MCVAPDPARSKSSKASLTSSALCAHTPSERVSEKESAHASGKRGQRKRDTASGSRHATVPHTAAVDWVCKGAPGDFCLSLASVASLASLASLSLSSSLCLSVYLSLFLSLSCMSAGNALNALSGSLSVLLFSVCRCGWVWPHRHHALLQSHETARVYTLPTEPGDHSSSLLLLTCPLAPVGGTQRDSPVCLPSHFGPARQELVARGKIRIPIITWCHFPAVRLPFTR